MGAQDLKICYNFKEEIIMKNVLLLWTFLLAFDVNSMSFGQYSENGICIHVMKNHTKPFVLTPVSEDIAIGERKIEDKEVKKIASKTIDDVNTGISLHGKKDGIDSNRLVYLKCDGQNILTFSFKLDPHNGRQLLLESVTRGTPLEGVSVGLFREIGGGGITYRLVIEKAEKAIELLESIQQMPFPSGQQERLQKVEIK
jgi:hypothetical protein